MIDDFNCHVQTQHPRPMKMEGEGPQGWQPFVQLQ